MKFPNSLVAVPVIGHSSRWLLAFGIFLLAACASTPPPSNPPPPPQSSPPPSPQTQSQQSPQDAQSPPSEASEQQAQSQSGEAQAEPASASQGEAAKTPPGSQAGAPAAGAVAQTRAERARALDGEFDRSLGDFDERLAREQGELQGMEDKQASANQQRARQDGGQAGGGQPGSGEGQISRAPAPLPPVTGGGLLPEEGTRRRGPGSPGDRASLPPVPDDVPSGQNDDVVARQLREAAENETDPALREKLWDEYRQYKRNSG